jgi:hypothetical protein
VTREEYNIQMRNQNGTVKRSGWLDTVAHAFGVVDPDWDKDELHLPAIIKEAIKCNFPL